MTTQTRPSDLAVIAAQAAQLQHTCPELFAHLIERDRKLSHALRHIPSPADIELSATWNQRKFFEKALARCGASIEELAGDC